MKSNNSLFKKELNYILRSEIKFEILINLYYKSLTVKELSETINYSSVSSNIKQLENKGFIKKDGEEYILTNSMRKKMVNLLYFDKVINSVCHGEDYLNTHLVKLDKLGMLSSLPLSKDYKIINNAPIDPYRVVNNFSKNMAENGKVKCIFTHIHPEFQKINKEDADYETELKILVTSDIKNYFVNNKKQSTKENILKNRIIKIKSIDPIKLSLVVSEKEVMIVLYKKDGTYDTNSALISNNLKFIKWGNELFDEIESISNDTYTVLNSL